MKANAQNMRNKVNGKIIEGEQALIEGVQGIIDKEQELINEQQENAE